MFKATIASLSHEGGLLAPFTGSSPALGSIIVRTDDGTYIGKIDGVLGNTDNPVAHIAHLDRKINPEGFIGCEAQIRAKTHRQENSNRQDGNQGHRDRNRRTDNRGRNQRPERDNHQRSRWRDDRREYSRDNRRDSFRKDSNRRDSNRQNPSRGRSRDRDSRRFSGRDRGGGNKTFTDNDWTCNKCNNVNFSFRKECNRCGEPKQTKSDGQRKFNGDKNQKKVRHNRNDGSNRKFRKARGKSSNHAHNRGPQPLNARARKRNRDD